METEISKKLKKKKKKQLSVLVQTKSDFVITAHKFRPLLYQPLK